MNRITNLFTEIFLMEEKSFARKVLCLIREIIRSRPHSFSELIPILILKKDIITEYFSVDDIWSIFSKNKSILLTLYENGFLNNEVIIRKSDISVAYFKYFFPEIQLIDYNFFMTKVHSYGIEQYIDNYSSSLEQFKQLRMEGHGASDVEIAIRKDDLISFQYLIEFYDMDINQTRIDDSGNFESDDFIVWTTPNFIEYAVFYGSIKIFKFLLLRGAVLTGRVSRFAFAGGNYEIIHILEDNKVDFDRSCLKTALEYHHHEIVSYLHDTLDINFNNQSVRSCIETCNYISLDYIFETQRMEIKKTNELEMKTKYGLIETI
ncbi:hypothetical protein TRFO_02820 [Tritrichomonas foetus]|uniref:DUF3447 domain-containing protein n=1 Tax=Tritrichomonas foetus TaxID=1144522 RepID=A0A1J4KX93_9EUKA|nr:hypothetical protein TRFO_02820 [Tritrichomonas foetus]|eukprot:OHT15504.1 hypothetical protein TRFO_02820 [Tritrichomonas foetus]